MLRKNLSREKLMRNVQEESFAVDEARLYLDTHPTDKKAQMFFDRHNQARKKAMELYEQQYGALLTDNLQAEKDGWTWINPPFPWDGGEN